MIIQSKKRPNLIEKAVYDYLLLKGFIFEKQKVVGNRFVVDAYIPSLNLVIEIDGKYWHSLPKAIERDKRKEQYLKTHGFKLLRLPEKEIRNRNFEKVLDEILKENASIDSILL